MLRRFRPWLPALALTLNACAAPGAGDDDDGDDDGDDDAPIECPDGVASLTTQAQVDALGRADCGELVGLVVSGRDITTLAALEGIAARDPTGARLELIDTSITDLTPLSAFVVDELVLNNNGSLSSLTGLALAAHARSIGIFGGSVLTNVDALGAVEEADVVTLGAAPGLVANAFTSLRESSDITIDGGFIEALELPVLERVTIFSITGAIESSVQLLSVDLPLLITINNGFAVYGAPELQRISMPSLTSAGAIVIRDVPNLVELDVHAMASVSGSGIDVGNAQRITEIALPALTSGTLLTFAGLPALGVLDLGALTSAGTITLSSCGPLPSLELPQLSSALETLNVTAVAGLASVVAPQLETVRVLQIVANPSFAQGDVDAFAATLDVTDRAKLARNGDPDAPLLDPCPFVGDGVCDDNLICVAGTDGDCQEEPGQ